MFDADRLQDLLESHKSFTAYRKKIAEIFPELHDAIIQLGLPYAEGLWLISNGLTARPECTCGKTLRYVDRTVGYRTYCSPKCAHNTSTVREKRKTTNLVRYGSEHTLAAGSRIRDKRDQTMVERYGSEHALQNKAILTRARGTHEGRSGEQKAQTVTRRKATIEERYGTSVPLNNTDIRSALVDKNQELYGVDWSCQRQDHIHRRSTTVRNVAYDKLCTRFDGVRLLTPREQYSGINAYNGGTAFEWLCDTCSTTWVSRVTNGTIRNCPSCHPQLGDSVAEEQIASLIRSLGYEVQLHDRSLLNGREIDILIPEKKLAIEFGGLYWHSEKKVDKNYHRDKLRACRELGYRLITIFEDEWSFKRHIVERRINHALSNTIERIYARKCQVVELCNKDANAFLTQYHIQGACVSGVRLGLLHGDRLIAVMTFGKRRTALSSKSKQGMELLRFCSSVHVVGGASKLFQHFLRTHNPDMVISYCDLRWGTGATYTQLGFSETSETAPGYWYTNGSQRWHRFNFAKYKLVRDGHDPSLTERQITDNLKLYRIWDCGNKVFTWSRQVQ